MGLYKLKMKDSEEMRKWLFLTVWHRCKTVEWGREVWKCVLKLKLPPPIQLHSFEKQKLCLGHSVPCWAHNSQEGGPNLCLPEKAMAPHSSPLAWKIPWTEELGRPQSMGSRRVRHDWTTSLSLFTFMHWRRKWQPTPGESQGWRILVGCRLWGSTESDTTEAI